MRIVKSHYQLSVVNRIRELRVAKKLSQIEIAKLLEVSNGYIGNVESPKFSHKYTLKQLWVLAKYFNVTIDYILTGKTDELTSTQLINQLISYDE